MQETANLKQGSDQRVTKPKPTDTQRRADVSINSYAHTKQRLPFWLQSRKRHIRTVSIVVYS
jgi:hypothetical protein